VRLRWLSCGCYSCCGTASAGKQGACSAVQSADDTARGAAEYEAGSEVFVRKIRSLESMYRSMRRARGDGNCFFRRAPRPLAAPGRSGLRARAEMPCSGRTGAQAAVRAVRAGEAAVRVVRAGEAGRLPELCRFPVYVTLHSVWQLWWKPPQWHHVCVRPCLGRACQRARASLRPAAPPQHPLFWRPSTGLRQESLLCSPTAGCAQPTAGRVHPAAWRAQVVHLRVHGAAGRHQRPGRAE